MLITPTNVNLFFTGLETRFWMAYGAAEVWNTRIAQTLPVTSELWTSGWIGMVDTYRLWDGPRVVREPAPQTYTVGIQPFELTESIDQFKLQDDTYGIYNATIPFMGIQAKKLPDYQLRDLLQNAKAQTGIRQLGTDGLPHFSTAHPIDFYDPSKGTYSNDFRGVSGFTVNGVPVGGLFTTTGFNTIWQEFASRKSESGEALGIAPDLVMGPMQLKGAMMTVLQSQFFAPPQLNGLGTGAAGTANAPFAGAMDNVLKGWTDLFHNADLNAQPNTWYMMITKGPMMPFNWLQREAPDFVPRIAPNDPIVFDQHKILYGSRARGAPAWGLPWLSAISNGGTILPGRAMGYASSTDLTTYGLPAAALGQLTPAQIAGALDAASETVDSYLRGRYALPLLAWGSEITEATAKIAAYNLLTIRGYNPAAGADINIKLRHDDAISWLNKVQRQAAHPNVTPQATQATAYGQPKVFSQSVTRVATGATSGNRGW